MDKTENLDYVTRDVKKRLKRLQNTGHNAWKIGEQACNVRNKELYQQQYSSFALYIEREFDKSAATIYDAIKVRELFTEEESRYAIRSVLLVLFDFTNKQRSSDNSIETIRLAVRLIALFEKNGFGKAPHKIQSWTAEFIIILLMEQSTALQITSLLNSIDTFATSQLTKNQKTILTNIWHHIIDYHNARTESSRVRATPKIQPIERNQLSTEFAYLTDLIHEPCNEMGVVGLFMLIFPKLTNYKFKFDSSIYQFKQIAHLQAPFPDGMVIAKSHDYDVDLYIEFEYESMNYIHHGHFFQRKNNYRKFSDHNYHNDKPLICVCWKNTHQRSPLSSIVPPTLDLSKLLQTGQLELE